MRKRWIFMAGMSVGYILGARAGREKFDRMVTRAHRVWEHPTVQEAAGVARAQAGRILEDGWHMISVKVGHLIPNRQPTTNGAYSNQSAGAEPYAKN